MAKVKYYAKENSSIGTHSFYAVPIPNMLKIKMRCDNCARWGETCEGMINPEEHCALWEQIVKETEGEE